MLILLITNSPSVVKEMSASLRNNDVPSQLGTGDLLFVASPSQTVSALSS